MADSRDNRGFVSRQGTPTCPSSMATRRTTPATTSANGVKLRQTQAEYTAARPNAEPGVKPMMSSSKMYVCIRCHANFKTGDGKPDPRLRGLGRCNSCLSASASSSTASAPSAS